jgi:hypothetical protein
LSDLEILKKDDNKYMISTWITIGLIISAVCVSSLGAYFSIVGLGALFSGALLAIWLMAGSLEFAKFTLAAYLHQTWGNLNKIYRTYLVFAVVVLSTITSVGVFGFLSDAYQSASIVLEVENSKLESVKKQQNLITNEIARLNKSVDEIPVTRVSRRLKLRAELEPTIKDLNKKFEDSEKVVAAANLTILDVKKKVGPLIYISKSFNMDIDSVVKYLIFVFVIVFDPLAICLVIASTHAIESRKNKIILKSVTENINMENDSNINIELKPDMKPVENAVEKVAEVAAEVVAPIEDIVVQMNFKNENEDKKAV